MLYTLPAPKLTLPAPIAIIPFKCCLPDALIRQLLAGNSNVREHSHFCFARKSYWHGLNFHDLLIKVSDAACNAPLTAACLAQMI
jgi:hypothetical protein